MLARVSYNINKTYSYLKITVLSLMLFGIRRAFRKAAILKTKGISRIALLPDGKHVMFELFPGRITKKIEIREISVPKEDDMFRFLRNNN